ncbi:putative allantoate permease [Scheffersomyces coipomensis]|uniref:putative allantoate permease n=1 Tax=Scheffersomyces coipomensis TaxID=1788519 RepID=UPI00315D1220
MSSSDSRGEVEVLDDKYQVSHQQQPYGEKEKNGLINSDVETITSSVDSVDSKNPFLDPIVADHYRQLYENSKYECRSAFDPALEWTQEEETKLVRKLDFRVAFSACLMFAALQVDRANLGQAVTDNFLNDLNLTTNDYNTGNTIFTVTFLLAELPSQIISKRLGPDIFIPIQMCAWSIVALSQGALKGKASFYATRALIGMIEGGFIADLVLWLSYFYTSKELSIRLSWFWTTLSIVGIGASLAAFGILRLRGHLELAGWRWLFIIEGAVTSAVGILSFYLMVPSALQTKNKLHPKGWFNEREEKIVVNRVLRDDPSKGDMHNRQPLTPRMIWKSLTDYDLVPLYIIGLIAYAPTSTLGAYQTLNLRELGFSTFNTNLLTIPANVIHIFLLLGVTWVSERVNEKSLVCLIVPIYTVPLVGVLAFWKGEMISVWPTWAVTTLVLGSPYIHAILVAWVSRNANSIRTRSVASAVYNIMVQLSGVYAANIYREDDKPLYHRGNRQLFGLAISMFPILILTKFYYIWRNSYRDKIWNKFSAEEKQDYINNTTDEGNKRLDFRFAH